MVKIQVLGHGLIPRGHGIAPRKEPFEADLNLIMLLLNAGTFKVSIQNPVTTNFIPVDSKNVKRIYATWNNYKAPKQYTTPVLHPTTPATPVVVTEEKKEEVVEEKKEPVVQNNNQNNQKNNNNQNNNNKNNQPNKPANGENK